MELVTSTCLWHHVAWGELCRWQSSPRASLPSAGAPQPVGHRAELELRSWVCERQDQMLYWNQNIFHLVHSLHLLVV